VPGLPSPELPANELLPADDVLPADDLLPAELHALLLQSLLLLQEAGSV
jgi:hypothetical protein